MKKLTEMESVSFFYCVIKLCAVGIVTEVSMYDVVITTVNMGSRHAYSSPNHEIFLQVLGFNPS